MTAAKQGGPASCGTYGGYQRHRKAGEDACAPCSQASRAYMAQWRSSEANREQGRAYARAQRRAVQALIARHRGEYVELLSAERRRDLGEAS